MIGSPPSLISQLSLADHGLQLATLCLTKLPYNSRNPTYKYDLILNSQTSLFYNLTIVVLTALLESTQYCML